MANDLEELNKLEQEIRETQQLLQDTDHNKKQLNSVKLQRNIFIIFTLLALGAFIWAFFFKDQEKLKNFNRIKDGNAVLIDKDSLNFYQSFVDSLGVYRTFYVETKKKQAREKASNNTNQETPSKSLQDEKVLYSVQFGMLKNYKLASDNLINLKEYTAGNISKYSLGNYTKYAEAQALSKKLKKVGIKDAFIKAESYGKPINIREALKLSNETQFLDK